MSGLSFLSTNYDTEIYTSRLEFAFKRAEESSQPARGRATPWRAMIFPIVWGYHLIESRKLEKVDSPEGKSFYRFNKYTNQVACLTLNCLMTKIIA